MPDTTSETPDCKPGPLVHIVVRVTGEYSDREVAVVGVYSELDIEKARGLTEEMKARDRAAYVIMETWHREFHKRWADRGRKGFVAPDDIDDVARALGMDPQPASGSADSEYTVVSIPLNEAGEWLL